MFKELKPAFMMMLVLTILTGLAYPGIMTALCEWLFPARAGGSLIVEGGVVIGSELLGQAFAKPEYFHPRPSAVNYDASASGASNLGPTNLMLIDRMREDLQSFRKDNPHYLGEIPSDLLTASGSGLDPHISPASALAQVARVAAARGIPADDLRKLVRNTIEQRQLGILGEPRVNVLLLNLALNRRFPLRSPRDADPSPQ